MYKLVAIDLDGTMLDSYGMVTEETKKTIKKVEEQGVSVIIASGRPIDSIKSIANEIDSKKIPLYYDEEIIAIPYKIFLNKLLSSFNMKMKKPLWVAQELKREGYLRMTQTVGRGFSQQIWINSLKKREYCLVLDKKRLEEEYELL